MPVAVAAPVRFAECPTCLGGGAGGAGVTTLAALTDVTLTGPLQAGQTLVHNGVTWINRDLNLNDLGDVNAVAPTAGQTIVWDPAANAGAGGYVLGTAGGNATLFLSNTAVGPATAGQPTLAEIAAAAGANRDRVLIYSGTDNAGDPITHAFHIDSAGLVTLVNEPTAGTANPIVFLSNTAVAPATAGSPTLAEITAAAGANRDTFLVYTGTDNAGDPVVSSYYIDSAGTVALVHEPAGAANPTLFLPNAAVAPATTGEPTIAEITAAAGANRDRMLVYTGTDNAGDPISHAYWIDSVGTVTLVHEPQVATCGMREMGGVGGVLAIGDGAGVPNPVQTGYTLAADRTVGIVTTPPVGGSDTFEVRLMPANSVITTGTIAAGATAATFTPFADLAFATGQWVEVVVTAVSPGTPSSELTVTGEQCGPGTPTTAGAAPAVEVGEGSVLPADDSQGELFRLQGHATLPDGLYRWDFNLNTWIQV